MMARELRYTLLAVWIPGFVLVAAAVIVSVTSDINARQLFQDANTVAGVPFYIGSLSMLGVILWAMTAAICLFVAPRPAEGDPDLRRLLLVSGIFTLVLMADDAFLFHDDILPRYAGISGDLYGVAYVVAMAVYLLALRSVLARTNYLLLGVALVLFGISAVTDVGSSRLHEFVPAAIVEIVEDGTKLVGIGTWLAYFVSVGRAALVPDRTVSSGQA